jgi:hypothetical protein
MAAPKGKKTVPVTDKKRKKPMSSLTIEHILRPPTPGYLDKERWVIMEENLKKMGCGKLWDLPWRYFDEQIAGCSSGTKQYLNPIKVTSQSLNAPG